MRRYRNTKIVATLGPSSRTKRQIRSMIKAGVDVFRLNFSHGSHEDHRSRFNAIRQLEKELDWPVAIMADLQGPKLRIGVFENDEVELTVGSSFVLDLKEVAGSVQRVQLPHQEIFDAAVVGMDLLLDDGKIRLRVQNAKENSIETKVITGGTLSNRKGVNVPGVTLGLSSLSEKDREDLEFALSLGFDWIALSFVQRPKDVAEARELINGRASVLIKLEKPAAIEHLDELVKMSDAVMVARMPQAQNIKSLVAELKKTGRPEASIHQKVFRPWGYYENLKEGELYKVKRILVRPGESLSLQLHHHRSEHWVVVRGVAMVTIEENVFELKENQSCFIPEQTRHRLRNNKKFDLEIIEVQTGSYLEEDDIVRFDDDYGR